MYKDTELFPEATPVQDISVKGGNLEFWEPDPFAVGNGERRGRRWRSGGRKFLISNRRLASRGKLDRMLDRQTQPVQALGDYYVFRRDPV